MKKKLGKTFSIILVILLLLFACGGIVALAKNGNKLFEEESYALDFEGNKTKNDGYYVTASQPLILKVEGYENLTYSVVANPDVNFSFFVDGEVKSFKDYEYTSGFHFVSSEGKVEIYSAGTYGELLSKAVGGNVEYDMTDFSNVDDLFVLKVIDKSGKELKAIKIMVPYVTNVTLSEEEIIF